MNIENLEAFVYVIHYNSFNKAADALFLSQPSVTARIQSLERDLNTLLFEREGRNFTLTDKGKQFLPFAGQILQTYKKGKQQIQHVNKAFSELRVGCTVSVSNYVIPEILPFIKKQRSQLQIKLTTAPTEVILEMLLNKEIDIGFVRNVTHPYVENLGYYEDPIRLFVYPNHPFVTKKPLTMNDVSRESLVFFECGSLDWGKIHRLFATLDHPPQIEYQIDNLETAKKLVSKGMGISFLPELCVRQEVKEGHLVPINIQALGGLSLRTTLVTLKESSLYVSDLFLDVLKEFNWKKIAT
ncbi:LysR family transcriptional regulator [Paenibacillus pectinilyticus]|uniref:LysR family transcriptional regulator n=1 Tax=Paenibacillus pectinilyticus TaxID=512399 RepID=A0A1C0ZUH5_9BACL|nr:LysR family transcriptional regulator [Paenibacillus pectinilyticus]OCT11755.1 LysR family transcriptional regulator [Paenibacillus pectinilyticus]